MAFMCASSSSPGRGTSICEDILNCSRNSTEARAAREELLRERGMEAWVRFEEVTIGHDLDFKFYTE